MRKEEFEKLKLMLPTEKEIFDSETRSIYFNNATGNSSDFVKDMNAITQDVWLTNDIRKNIYENDCVYGYTKLGYVEYNLNEQCKVRPVIDLNDVDILQYATLGKGFLEGKLEIELGEYPQETASREVELDLCMHKGVLTGKKYSIQVESSKNELNIVQIEEYEYKGKRYVCIPRKNRYMAYTWYEVAPIKWIVDLKHNKLICKNTIIVGRSYNNWSEYVKYLEYDMIYNTKEYKNTYNQLIYRMK